MNPLRKAVLAVSCPTCGAEVGQRCLDDPPRGKVNEWHGARFRISQPRAKIRLPAKRLRRGSNPCSKCASGNHCQCPGSHPRKYGLPGLPCTCECAVSKRKRESA